MYKYDGRMNFFGLITAIIGMIKEAMNLNYKFNDNKL